MKYKINTYNKHLNTRIETSKRICSNLWPNLNNGAPTKHYTWFLFPKKARILYCHLWWNGNCFPILSRQSFRWTGNLFLLHSLIKWFFFYSPTVTFSHICSRKNAFKSLIDTTLFTTDLMKHFAPQRIFKYVRKRFA